MDVLPIEIHQLCAPDIPPNLLCVFGLQECINGTWTSCWILLQKRTLVYTRGHELFEVDLRKARHVGECIPLIYICKITAYYDLCPKWM